MDTQAATQMLADWAGQESHGPREVLTEIATALARQGFDASLVRVAADNAGDNPTGQTTRAYFKRLESNLASMPLKKSPAGQVFRGVVTQLAGNDSSADDDAPAWLDTQGTGHLMLSLRGDQSPFGEAEAELIARQMFSREPAVECDEERSGARSHSSRLAEADAAAEQIVNQLFSRKSQVNRDAATVPTLDR